MNFPKLILGTDGTVYDYFSGIQHIKERRIVFVGDATTRIQEDYLRILRYFRYVLIDITCRHRATLSLGCCRFYGRIAKETNCYDQETLDAIKENVSGLSRISGERVWAELKKILEGNYAGDLIQTMLKVGVAEFIGN
jgi:tRNA nucleotidyltransferase (CCA-adding enzyme)